MIEKHPFGNFVPINPRYLLLGSFTGKQASDYDWFYSNGRNQFWPIIEAVYSTNLTTKQEKQDLFGQLGIAVADIILACDRRLNNNLDTNLINIVYNTAISDIISKHEIKTVFFSSRFTEKLFVRQFKSLLVNDSKMTFVTLPSPSPRYATMSKLEKIAKYKSLLPEL